MAAFARFGRAARQNTAFARVARAAIAAESPPAASLPPAIANTHNGGPMRPGKGYAARRVRRSQDSSSFNRAPQEHL
jgi:hypothetical protein